MNLQDSRTVVVPEWDGCQADLDTMLGSSLEAFLVGFWTVWINTKPHVVALQKRFPHHNSRWPELSCANSTSPRLTVREAENLHGTNTTQALGIDQTFDTHRGRSCVCPSYCWPWQCEELKHLEARNDTAQHYSTSTLFYIASGITPAACTCASCSEKQNL